MALFLSHAVAAEESGPIIHTLEWSSSDTSSSLDQTTHEARQDDVWQRIRRGFGICFWQIIQKTKYFFTFSLPKLLFQTPNNTMSKNQLAFALSIFVPAINQ